MGTAFDTQAYAERLKAAGIENAHAHADALRAAVGEGVATKAGVRKVRADIARIEENMTKKLDRILLDKHMDFINNKMATKADFARVDKRIEVLGKRIDNIYKNMATKTELARMETRLQRSINRAMFAMVGLTIALAAAIIAAIGLMM